MHFIQPWHCWCPSIFFPDIFPTFYKFALAKIGPSCHYFFDLLKQFVFLVSFIIYIVSDLFNSIIFINFTILFLRLPVHVSSHSFKFDVAGSVSIRCCLNIILLLFEVFTAKCRLIKAAHQAIL